LWTLEPTEEYERRFKYYSKKHRRELTAILSNLNKFVDTLNDGTNPKPFVFGFLHAEPSDVVAIDPGGGKNLVATRLYAYPDVAREVLHLLTIGGKPDQHDDIQNCKRLVIEIKRMYEKGGSGSHDQGDPNDSGDRAKQSGGGSG
jgi:hypothetical protein